MGAWSHLLLIPICAPIVGLEYLGVEQLIVGFVCFLPFPIRV